MGVTEDEIKGRYPTLGAIEVQLTVDYCRLTKQAIDMKLIAEQEILEIEGKYTEIEYTLSCLVHKIADVLTIIKAIVTIIQIPKEKLEFEKWVQYSADYPKVVCYDALVDIFISSSNALNKGL